MYFCHKTTDPPDKIFALLGMSTDDTIPADLLVDYGATWEEVFCSFIRTSLFSHASVTVWADHELAIIEAKSQPLGVMTSTRYEAAADRQSKYAGSSTV